MERDVYRSMRELQRDHWWFQGRRRIVSALVDSLDLPDGATILEAGAGSGGNIAMLRRHGAVSAFEMDAEAARYCTADTGIACPLGMLPDANPFEGQARFDLVVALDVLEHIEQDVESLRSLGACLAPGGRLLLTVPAYPWLYSGHDLIHHHRRRYTRRGLERVVAEAGLRVHRSGYFNAALLPVVVALRLGARLLRRPPASDASMPGPRVNALLAGLFGAESRAMRRGGFPAGLSLFLVAGAP
jgi:SAM-dependent methyltransferase